LNEKKTIKDIKKLKKNCKQKAKKAECKSEYFEKLFKSAMDKYNKKKPESFLAGELNKRLWEKPRFFEGLKTYFYGSDESKKLLHLALTYWNGLNKNDYFVEEENINVNKRFFYNRQELTEEDRIFICDQLHIDYELKERNKFLKQKDYLLKRYILKEAFGCHVIEQNNKGKVVLSDSELLGMCLVELKLCCERNKLYFTDEEINKIEKQRETDALFTSGRCLIVDRDDSEN